MNVAIVIDKSRSMAGDKIAGAKAAARAAVEVLGPDDIVSVVAYDSTVEVLVPATKAGDRDVILRGIDRLRHGGSTALFGGTSKGAAEVRKFLARDCVNRVVLLSDGRANVGPSSPGDLARLGSQLAREGIGVTTVGLGLGFNEDLMVALAERSGGNHFFVEDAGALGPLFAEGFRGLASVVAKEVSLTVTFSDEVRPVRALGVDADIVGRTLRFELSQLYAAQTDELVVELEVGPTPVSRRDLAKVTLSYRNTATARIDHVQTTVTARFSDDPAVVEASANRAVLVSVAERVANLASRRALELRDAGKVAEARAALIDNSAYLEERARALGSGDLRALSRASREDADNLDQGWRRQRKSIRQRINQPFQHETRNF